MLRIHHCIADGIALARVMLSLTDPADASGAPPPRAAAPLSGRGGVAKVLVGGATGDAYLRMARRNIASAIRSRSRKTSSMGPRLKGI